MQTKTVWGRESVCQVVSAQMIILILYQEQNKQNKKSYQL